MLERKRGGAEMDEAEGSIRKGRRVPIQSTRVCNSALFPVAKPICLIEVNYSHRFNF